MDLYEFRILQFLKTNGLYKCTVFQLKWKTMKGLKLQIITKLVHSGDVSALNGR